MLSKKASVFSVWHFIVAYLVLYILLFGFILPVNKILPGPVAVLNSFGDLWTKYDLTTHFISTVSVIGISLIAAYFFINSIRITLLKGKSVAGSFIYSLEWFSEFIPGIVIGLLLIFWFPGSGYTEIIFAFLTCAASLMIKLKKISKETPDSYIEAYKSIGANEKQLASLIKWKAAQPKLVKHLYGLHFYLWSVLLAFEYINNGVGLGVILRKTLLFNDLAALVTVFIIIGITIFIGQSIINFIRIRRFNWRAD